MGELVPEDLAAFERYAREGDADTHPADRRRIVYSHDLLALVARIRELQARYGRGDEVWCGARRDQAGSAYCTEMAGHEQHGHPHLWSWERWSWERKALEGR